MSFMPIQKICKVCNMPYSVSDPLESLVYGNVCRSCRKKAEK